MSLKLLHHLFGSDIHAWNKSNVDRFMESYSEIFLTEHFKPSESTFKSLLSLTQEQILGWIGTRCIPLDSNVVLKNSIAEYRKTMRKQYRRKSISTGNFIWKNDLAAAHNSAIEEATKLLDCYIKCNPKSSPGIKDLKAELQAHLKQEYAWLTEVNDFNRTEFIQLVESDIGDDFKKALITRYGKLFDVPTPPLILPSLINSDDLEGYPYYDEINMTKFIQDELIPCLLHTFQSYFPGMQPAGGDNWEYKQICMSKEFLEKSLTKAGQSVQVKNQMHKNAANNRMAEFIKYMEKQLLPESKSYLVEQHAWVGVSEFKNVLDEVRKKILTNITKYSMAVAIENEDEFMQEYLEIMRSKLEPLFPVAAEHYKVNVKTKLLKYKMGLETDVKRIVEKHSAEGRVEKSFKDAMERSMMDALSREVIEVENKLGIDLGTTTAPDSVANALDATREVNAGKSVNVLKSNAWNERSPAVVCVGSPQPQSLANANGEEPTSSNNQVQDSQAGVTNRNVRVGKHRAIECITTNRCNQNDMGDIKAKRGRRM